ncbi:hypothetical protein MSBR3_3207 [Methanosarcina barkeri 3]|uniref:Uncharacterized protein n=1 Tax=Methanosarcina barkeri 3 TaxID=1434107 RepID=A0A0E3WYE8_METBA|nr:hypothetical protein [Methanosarcina barkeri]AKB83785.1 hypothetical protein MSBR3_3207 [Methanosarcina barkeri 3]
MAAGDKGLEIINISNPSSPKLKGRYNTAGRARSVAVSDNYAYVADGDNGFVTVDISNPSSPTLKGKYETGYADCVAVSGNYAYLVEDSDGLVFLISVIPLLQFAKEAKAAILAFVRPFQFQVITPILLILVL